MDKERTQHTGYKVKTPLFLRIVLHLAGEQVEFSWRPISLSERKRRGTDRKGVRREKPHK